MAGSVWATDGPARRQIGVVTRLKTSRVGPGSAVARAFAREGAHVSLAGRTMPRLQAVANTIHTAGGTAEVATVDVLDRAAVEAHTADVAGTRDGIDIVFNATSNDDVQGATLAETSFDDVMRPVIKAVTAHLVIATAVAPHVKAHRTGVILVMVGGREAIPALGGSHIAWSALAGLCRQLACELGPDGIRVAWLLSPGSPDAGDDGHDPDAQATMLKRLPTLDDVANAAVFVSSDWAATMTATEVNITGGAVVD
jgi:3-oxoacyl-[acyl-carrier protein] reductase